MLNLIFLSFIFFFSSFFLFFFEFFLNSSFSCYLFSFLLWVSSIFGSTLDFVFLYEDSFTYQCDGIIHLHNSLFCLIFGIVIFVFVAILFTYFEHRLIFRIDGFLKSLFFFIEINSVYFNLFPIRFFSSVRFRNRISVKFRATQFWAYFLQPGRRDIFISWLNVNLESVDNFFLVKRSMSFLFNYCYKVARFCHGTLLETIWTIIPSLILLNLAIPSFMLLYALDETCDSFDCIKILGNQWYWSYEVMQGSKLLTFDSYMISDDYLNYGDLRLLEVDAPLIVSTAVSYRLLISSLDVLHCWTLPAVGVKIDACPGRLNLGYLLLKHSGQIYGQCSELCGIGHGFMPISILSVSAYAPLFA